MAKAIKSAEVLQMEGRSHKTKKELAQRREMEAQIYTGRKIREAAAVKADPIAHETFKRTSGDLDAIGKNDALFENCINRYCMITARVYNLQRDRQRIIDRPDLKETDRDKLLNGVNRQITANERLLFEMEKENLLTIQSAARFIVGNPKPKKSALMEALESGG